MSKEQKPEVTRFSESGWKKFAGGAAAAAGVGLAFWFGIRPVWERNDDVETVKAVSALAAGTCAVILAFNDALLPTKRDDRGKVRTIFAAVGLLSLGTFIYAARGGQDDGNALNFNTDPTAASQTTAEAVTTLPAPEEAVVVTSIAPDSGESLAFVYNNGNPIPAGQCAIDAPITGETSGDEVKILQTKLNEAGFDAGSVDGHAGNHTSEAVNRLQVAFGMPESLAIDPATKWNQSDCYQAFISIPGFSDMWVNE